MSASLVTSPATARARPPALAICAHEVVQPILTPGRDDDRRPLPRERHCGGPSDAR